MFYDRVTNADAVFLLHYLPAYIVEAVSIYCSSGVRIETRLYGRS